MIGVSRALHDGGLTRDVATLGGIVAFLVLLFANRITLQTNRRR